MGFGLEIEPRWFSNFPDFDVLLVRQSDRDRWVGQVRNCRGELEKLFFNGFQGLFYVLDFLGDDLHFIALVGNVDLFPEALRNLLGRRIPELPEAFHFENELFALTIELSKRLYVERKAPMCESFTGRFQIVAEICEIDHFRILEQTARGSKKWPNCLTGQAANAMILER